MLSMTSMAECVQSPEMVTGSLILWYNKVVSSRITTRRLGNAII